MTGCSTFSSEIVGPTHPPFAVPPAKQPLRLVVGLSGTEEVTVLRHEKYPMPGEFRELKAHFAERLRALSLFQELLYPVVPHAQPDLTFQVRLQVKFQPDWTAAPKVLLMIMTYFLAAPLVNLEHHYAASGDLAIIHRNRLIKAYTANSDVIVRIGPLSVLRKLPPIQQAAFLARDSMITDLLRQLIQDREFLSQFEERF
jgi:hypothetical protein